MPLTHDQKNYIKKHIKVESLTQIAQFLSITEGSIADYLKKRWGEEKFNNFIKKPSKTTETGQIQSNNPKTWLKDNWLHLLILSLLVIFTYAFFLNNAFVSDDIAEIVQKPEIANFSRVLMFPTGPIRHIIYWAAFHINGLSPIVFRLSNIVFHLLSTYLVYIILFLIYKSKKISFFAASLFAIHPALSETVLWISGGIYTQYTFFFLLSFLLYILSVNSKKAYWCSVISYLFSLMSHPQMPLVLFIIYPLFDFCFRNVRKNWLKLIPYFLLVIFYVFVNLGALPERETTLQTVHYQEKGIDNPLVQLPVAISSYTELLLFPTYLTLYHSELSFSPLSFTIRSIFTVIFFAGFLLAFIKKHMSIFFWLSFSIIALSPTLTPFRLNWIVAERYIYLPSFGIFTLIAIGLNNIIKAKKNLAPSIYTIFAILLIILLIRTILRGIDWENEDNLWIATGKTSPSSPNTHNNLGDVYGRHGDKQAALREFQTAILLKPNYGDAYHNLANTYRELNQIDKALENYQKAIQYNPGLWQSYQNIAALYFQQKQYDLALYNIQKAIAINPNNINLRNNLGVVYLASGNKEKAREVFSLVLSADPQNQFALGGLAQANK